MKTGKILMFLTYISHPQFATAQDIPSNVIKSQTLLAHWSCMVYSNYIENKDNAERHYEAGLRDGKIFVSEARNGKLTEQELYTSAPHLVVALLQGPSDEFVLGRLFEGIRDYAYERVAQKAETGHDSLHFETEPEVLRIKAETLYRSSNCELLN